MLKTGKVRRNSTVSTLSTQRKRRASPLALIGIGVTLLVALSAGIVFILPRIKSHAAALNMNCTLLIPANPLTAQGLATPYQLSATNAADGPCNESNANQSAFVQGVIYNPATGAFSVYSPLIIDAGTQPAVVPTAPTLPQGAVVALWFGFNATNLTLQGAQNNTLGQARCVNGLRGSVFGQFAYCNAQNFFAAARRGIAAGKVTVPATGMGKDGLPCPTTRDFGIVDQDPSDNVQTQYLATTNGQIAQLTAANQAQFPNATVLGNPSDNALVTAILDPALGCTPWTAPNLADNNNPVSAVPLDELMAAADQQAPIALVPINDPMVLNNANPNLQKTNLYRLGVDQTPARNQNQANGATFCTNMIQKGIMRLQTDQQIFTNVTSPAPAAANSLFTFLGMRLQQSYVNLGCQGLLNKANPVTLQLDGNGVVIGVTFNLAAFNGTGTTTGTTGAGGVQQLAMGTASFNLDSNAKSVAVNLNVVFPNHPNTNVDVQVLTGSCTGTVLFNQNENLGATSANNASTVINNVTSAQIPNNWFFALASNNQTVGCGSVVPSGTGTTATATLGTVLAALPAEPQVQAMGTAALTLNADTQTANLAPVFTYVLRGGQAVTEEILTGSCTGTVFFSTRIDLAADGASSGDVTINNVQALPNNWFFAVVDPQQTGANGQPLVVGCGIFKVNSTVTAQATLGVLN